MLSHFFFQIVRVEEDDDYSMTPFVSLGSSSKSSKEKKTSPEDRKQSAIDITAEDLIPRLMPQNVADLVLLSMVGALFIFLSASWLQSGMPGLWLGVL